MMQSVLHTFREENELIVFDVETTGLSSTNDRVIQFSAIRFAIRAGELEEKDRIDVFINPGFSLPEKISDLTGITDDILLDKPSESEAFQKIYSFWGNPKCVCGQNVCFDIRFLNAMYERYGKSFTPTIVLDTLKMAKELVSESQNKKLETLARYYEVDKDLAFHNSMDDVIACSRLLEIFKKEYLNREEQIIQRRKNKTRVKVNNLKYWSRYPGRARIYIYTDCGEFFYDIYSKTWGSSPSSPYDIECIDVEQMKIDSYNLAGVTTERDFARFRG